MTEYLPEQHTISEQEKKVTLENKIFLPTKSILYIGKVVI